jgi:hypothetical protein
MSTDPLAALLATTMFRQPNDFEYRTLKAEYSFNDQALRGEFLVVSNKINLDNMMLAKQHNLVLFRHRCGPSVTLPRELFSFDVAPTAMAESLALKTVIPWTEKDAQYDLATEISKVYPGTPWIVEYFVTSSFPAIFGHFVSAEYLENGLLFVEGHISDPLAPRLVGTFLLHAFLFRDRLLQVFFQELSTLPATDSFALEVLKDKFTRAFFFCMPYLSEAHVRAVRRLRAQNPQGAVEAVFTCFLLETIKLWPFCPLFTTTEIILRRKPGTAPHRDWKERFETVLVSVVERLSRDPQEAKRFLDLFSDEIGMEMPRISTIIFYGGVKFPLTVVDIGILCQLHELLKTLTGTRARPVAPRVCVETAAVDAFRIRCQFAHFLQPSVHEPQATEASPFPTRQKLLEHRAMHEFLFGIAGGLKQFHTIIAAQKSINVLQYKALADHLYRTGAESQAANFANFQRRQYALHIFDNWVLGIFLEWMKVQPAGSRDAHERELESRINRFIAEKKRPATEALHEATAEYVNEWKRRFNAQSPSLTQAMVDAGTDQACSFCPFFTEAVDIVVFALVASQVTGCQLSIVDRTVNQLKSDRLEKLKRNLQDVSICWPYYNFDIQEAIQSTRDLFVDGAEDVKFLLARADESIKIAFENGDDRFQTGTHFLLYLEIEAQGKLLFLSDIAEDAKAGDPDWDRKLMCALLDGRDPIYLRAALPRVVACVNQLYSMELPSIQNLLRIGNPIDESIVDAFRHVRDWLGMDPQKLPFV